MNPQITKYKTNHKFKAVKQRANCVEQHFKFLPYHTNYLHIILNANNC